MPTPSLLAWVHRTVMPMVVFVCLGGLLAWGHFTGWTLPTFSSLVGKADSNGGEWCSQHNVPESQCVECNPDLMPRSKVFGWCETHGVHECPLDHPEVAQTTRRPSVSAADLALAQRTLAFADRPRNNRKCKAHERRIQFTSDEIVQRAGIEVDVVSRAADTIWKTPIVEFVAGNGEITYDQTRTARLSARVPGTVFRAFKKVGDRVDEGEVIALVDAADVGRAKSEFCHAFAQLRLKTEIHRRMTGATASVPERSVREAETALSEAKIRFSTAQQTLTNLGLPIQPDILTSVPDDQLTTRIQFLGLPKTLTESLDARTTTGNLLPIAAPFGGVVVHRDVVAGEVVDAAKVLFVVADVREMWLTLDLRMEDARRVKLGHKVRFRPDGSRDEATGTIVWISTEADRKTRTVKVRAMLDNREGLLRANTFGAGKVILREESEAIVVPNEAVHWEGDCFVVFVRDKNYLKPDAPKVFHTRTVRIGVKDDKQTEIVAGVLPGEVVATKGSAALRAELLRGNLGEG